MAQAVQQVFSHTDSQVEIWKLSAATARRTLVKRGSRFGVTLTDTEGVARPDLDKVLYGDVKISGVRKPGVGNDKATAIGEFATGVATDGTWLFENVTGVNASTEQGVAVYVKADNSLTLTATDATKIGEINYPATFTKAAGKAPVKIGV